MNPSRPFILRPVATSLLMVAILLAGVVAFRLLPLSALPEVDYPTIQVLTLYPGASPDVMTSSVTAPLERQFGQMPGLNQMSSTSSGGASVITLQFSLELTLDVAEQEVQAAINAAGNLLPTDLPAPPIYTKVNPADAPILTLALTSKTLPLPQVEDLADTRLAQKISQLPGRRPGQHRRRPAAGGAHPGQPQGAGRLRPRPRRPAHRASATPTSTRPRAASTARRAPTTINANDQLQSADDYRDLIVAYKNGAPSACRDVADGRSTAPRTRSSAAWINDDAGDHPQHPAPARRQRHRGRRPHQAAAAAAAGEPAGRGRRRRC